MSAGNDGNAAPINHVHQTAVRVIVPISFVEPRNDNADQGTDERLRSENADGEAQQHGGDFIQ